MQRPDRTQARRARFALATGVTVIALLSVACGSDLTEDETSRDESGEVVGGGDVGALSLQVGDCVADSEVGEVNDVPVVPCDEPHDSEVFSVFDLPDGEFPGDMVVDDAAEDGCTGEDFAEYVGIEYAGSELDVAFIKPSRDTWNNLEDREVICLAANLDGTQLEEPVAGAAR